MSKTGKQLKFGAILSYLSIAISVLAGLVYTPWMIKKIGKSHYALYTLANSIITMFMVDFGLSATTTRYLAKYNAEGNKEAAEKFLSAIYKLYIIIDAIIFAVLTVYFFLIEKIYVGMTPVELEEFKIVYLISALFSVVNFPFITLNGILSAHEKFIPLKLADVLYRTFTVVFTIVALLFGMGVYALVSVHAIVGIINTIFKLVVVKKSVSIKVNLKNAEKGIYKEILSFSIWIVIASLGQRLVFTIMPTILGAVASTASIAVFGVVATIEGHSYSFSTAINGMFMPRISRMITNDTNKEEYTTLAINVGKFQFFLNGLLVVGFALIGKSFINLWMGPDYSDAYLGILLVIFPGIILNSLQIANTTMTVLKKVKEQALIILFTGLLSMCLAIPLAKSLGVLGGCLAICIAYIIRGVVSIIVYHKILPISMGQFAKKCFLRMAIPLLLTFALGIGVNWLISDGGWIILGLKIIIITVIYFLSGTFIGLDKNERKKFFNKLFKKSKKEENKGLNKEEL